MGVYCGGKFCFKTKYNIMVGMCKVVELVVEGPVINRLPCLVSLLHIRYVQIIPDKKNEK